MVHLQVIRHTSRLHPHKMHTFDNLNQMNIEWKPSASNADRRGARRPRQNSSEPRSGTSNSQSDDVSDESEDSLEAPVLSRQNSTNAADRDGGANSPPSTTPPRFPSIDSNDSIDVAAILSDSEGLVQWAVEQGPKLRDHVQKVLDSCGAFITELKFLMRIVKRPEARYGCVADEFKCNDFVDFKLHMREKHEFPQLQMWGCKNCR